MIPCLAATCVYSSRFTFAPFEVVASAVFQTPFFLSASTRNVMRPLFPASFLRQAVESATQKGSAPGCLLVCVAPLVDDAEVRKFLQNAVVGGVTLLEGRFRDGISAGEIPSDFPVAVRAIQVTDLARGLTMRAQMGTPR
jgi:hypothetical protein